MASPASYIKRCIDSTHDAESSFANNGISVAELNIVLDYSHNPRISFISKKFGTMEAALGWPVSPLGNENMKCIWQEGITGGLSSFIVIVETTKTGFVILSNSTVALTEPGKKILEKIN